MRPYEVIFILDPALTDEALEAEVSAAKAVVAREGGEVREVQKWGKKRLAYEVRKHRDGHYVFLRVVAGPKAVAELERHFKIAEPVLKYLTVRAEEPRTAPAKGKAKAPATLAAPAAEGAS